MFHVAIELPWHDRGWDGSVCANPARNSSCHALVGSPSDLDLRIETSLAGKPWLEGTRARAEGGRLASWRLGRRREDPLRRYRIPCWNWINAFGSDFRAFVPEAPHRHRVAEPRFNTEMGQAYEVVHKVPYRAASPAPLAPSSVAVGPDEWLTALTPPERQDPQQGRWIADPAMLRLLLDDFWAQVEPGNSLAVFYCRFHPWRNSSNQDRVLLVGAVPINELQAIPDHVSSKVGAVLPAHERFVTHEWPRRGIAIRWPLFVASAPKTAVGIAMMPMTLAAEQGERCRLIDSDVAQECVLRLFRAWERLPDTSQFSPEGASLCGNVDWAEHYAPPANSSLGNLPTWLRALGIAQPYAAARQLASFESELRPERLIAWLSENPERAGYWLAQGVNHELRESRIRLACMLSAVELPVQACAQLLWERKSKGVGLEDRTILRNPYELVEKIAELGDDRDTGIRFRISDADRCVASSSAYKTFKPVYRSRALIHGRLLRERDANAWQDCEYLEDVDPSDVVKAGLDAEFVSAEEVGHLFHRLFIHGSESGSQGVGRRVDLGAANRVEKSLIGLSERSLDLQDIGVNAVLGLFEFEFGVTGRVLTVSGAAGTGKSHKLTGVIEWLAQENRTGRLAIVAPTGRAAAVLRGLLADRGHVDPDGLNISTIHSYLAWDERNAAKRYPEYLFVDEASMVDGRLMARLLAPYRLKKLKLLLLVGDASQLPPVGVGKPFHAWLDYASSVAPSSVCILPKVNQRKKAKDAVYDMADQLRRSASIKATTTVEPTRIAIPKGVRIEKWSTMSDLHSKVEREYLSHTKTAELIERVNTSVLDVQVICGRRVGMAGTKFLNAAMLRAVQGTDRLGAMAPRQLRRSDLPVKVIQTRNRQMRWGSIGEENYGRQIVPNGAIGVLLGKTKKRDVWKVHFREFPGKVFYYPSREIPRLLEPGYACTVHKAQGSSFKRVAIVLSEADLYSGSEAEPEDLRFRELLYTALTRHREKCVIFSQKGNGSDVFRRMVREIGVLSAVANRKCLIEELLSARKSSDSDGE